MLNQSQRVRRRIFLPIFNIFLSRKTNLWRLKRLVLNAACIDCKRGAKCVGPIIISHAAELTVGQDTWLGMDFKVYGSGKVVIGNNCDIGPDVAILSGSHEIGNAFRRAGKGFHYKTEILDGCWIGGRCTLMGNIKVGRGSVIGASSLVNKTISENVVVVGIPAKVIKNLESNI